MFLAPAMIAVLLQAASSTAPVDPANEPFHSLETKPQAIRQWWPPLLPWLQVRSC